MDQRLTTEAELYERLFPQKDAAYWLGKVLNYPVSDIPTREDLEREQGLLGVPTEEQSSRESGQTALDYLTMAHGIASLLRGGGSAAQELMGKRRGAETFGKETMDTLRRAQPQRWERMERESRTIRPEAGEDLLEGGRESYRRAIQQAAAHPGTQHEPLVPGASPDWTGARTLPSDVVSRGQIQMGRQQLDAYRIGEPVTLPGGDQAQYVVTAAPYGAYLMLDTGGFPVLVRSYQSMGEALAMARQMQNRLALAAKDMRGVEARFDAAAQAGDEVYPKRAMRFPWERGSTGRRIYTPEGPSSVFWPWDYQPPPRGGRWSE